MSANTITSGGATDSAAAVSTMALASAQHSRAAATLEELQNVPPKPDAIPGGFHSCPRCSQNTARWDVMRNGRCQKDKTRIHNLSDFILFETK